jgi:hypothetical protein
MSDDRTSPMKVPPKPKAPRGADPGLGGQETMAAGADQEGGGAPTIYGPGPGSPAQPAPGQGAGPGFVRATPQDAQTPPARPAMPFGPPSPGPFPPAGPGMGGAPGVPAGGPGVYQAPAPAEGQTMIIKERVPPVFAWLVVVDGPDRASIGKVHSLRPDTTTVGRAQGSHIILADETCSSQHFRVRIEAQEGEESAFVLYDMGSRNGVFVGDKSTYRNPDSQAYRHKLQDGDYVLVGETTLVFKRL